MTIKDTSFTDFDDHEDRPAAPQGTHHVWDIFVRFFHWSIVGLFTANAFFTAPKNDLHHWIGYTVAGLVTLRIIWGLVGSHHARFTSFPPSPSGALTQLRDMATGRRHAHLGHSPLGALMIYNLLVTLLVIAGSGYLMTTDAYWGVKWVEELHVTAVDWAEFSIAAHVVAVIYESRRLRVNLARAMITGKKVFHRGGR